MSLSAELNRKHLYLFQILLPHADNDGHLFPPEEFERFKGELAQRFSGVTAYMRAPAEGLWQQRGQSTGDDIVIFEVMTDAIDVDDWRKRRADLERRFRQEEVIIRYMPIARI